VERNKELLNGTYSDLPARGIREETCRRYGYQVGEKCHIANYRDDSGIIAQKVRRANKEFGWVGAAKSAGLFGQHLFSTGKSVVVTEGEIDCLSVSQAFNNKYPVVSLENGAPSATKSVKRAYEWLDQFDKIILCFDQDEPGLKAQQECAEILPPGKVFLMKLPLKDANETLLKAGTAPIVKAYWDATPWRPDGIVSGCDLVLDDLINEEVHGYSLPYPDLEEKSGGIFEGGITMLTAGSGIGKSTWAREIAYHLHQAHGLTIGSIYLEENVSKTAKGYIAIDQNVPLGKLRRDSNILTREQWEDSYARVVATRMYFYDHFGSLDSERLLSKMRYMRKVLGCNFIILDHISIVTSGQESSSGGERKDIDVLMTNLRSLVEETGVGVISIVHLSKPDGTSHEEGGRVTLSQLRGSGALKQLSDSVWALERDQQGENPNESRIRVLKDREGGEVGEADLMVYDKATGRLKYAEIIPKDAEGEAAF
jgi:twinkle protein